MKVKKMLSMTLAVAILMSVFVMSVSAEIGIVYAEPTTLLLEDFENESTASGGKIVNDCVRTGEKAYLAEVKDEVGAVSIPIGNEANAWKKKMLVAEAWYHIDGTVSAPTMTEQYPKYNNAYLGYSLYEGPHVNIAFQLDENNVDSYKVTSSNILSFENDVFPNTNTEGWYRIRAVGVIEDNDDISQSKLKISLVDFQDGTKLYVDDVKIFITDNIIDMCTDGNSDFDTYDATRIDGWGFWYANGYEGSYGTIEYSTTNHTSGNYSVKFKRNQGQKNYFGLMCNTPLEYYGAVNGTSVIMYINGKAEMNGDKWWASGFYLNHPYLGNSPESYPSANFKTMVSGPFTPSGAVNTLRIRYGFSSSLNTTYAAETYFDDVKMKVIPNKGIAGFKKSATTGNEGNTYVWVDSLSHGDIVYPFAYFSEEQQSKVTILVARYINVEGKERLDDISVQTFDSYKAATYATEHTAITVPTTGAYTYKIMAWGDTMEPRLDVFKYEVK